MPTGVRIARERQIIKREVEQAHPPARILVHERGNAGDLRCDEARSATLEDFKSHPSAPDGGIGNDVSRLRIGVQRYVRKIPAWKVGGQLEELRRRSRAFVEQHLPRLARSYSFDKELVERDGKHHAHATTSASWEDAAIDRIGVSYRVAQRGQVIPAPGTLRGDIDRECLGSGDLIGLRAR